VLGFDVLNSEGQACETPNQDSVFFWCIVSNRLDYKVCVSRLEDAVAIVASVGFDDQTKRCGIEVLRGLKVFDEDSRCVQFHLVAA
jgi:hypothetical protein